MHQRILLPVYMLIFGNSGGIMSSGFVISQNGHIKFSWVWQNADLPCPFPDINTLTVEDRVYTVDNNENIFSDQIITNKINFVIDTARGGIFDDTGKLILTISEK